ncbi:MAG: hypothetical protein LBH30_04885, partial [Prevotellaceae bacterium]|nr:hypothetical protein [Prevotellaceae bacterium]
ICFAGIVTESKELITKKGKPFGRVTIEDYSGTYSFSLFDKEWIDYKNYFTLNYFLMIRGNITERRKFIRKDENGKNIENNDIPIFDLKIEKIMMLHSVREDLISSIEIILPLSKITNDFIKRINKQISANKGNKKLCFVIIEEETNTKIERISRKYRVNISTELLEYLKNNYINYKINTY